MKFSFFFAVICDCLTSLPMRGEWIEIEAEAKLQELREQSLPMRGEWIEIILFIYCKFYISVSPHAGRVD